MGLLLLAAIFGLSWAAYKRTMRRQRTNAYKRVQMRTAHNANSAFALGLAKGQAPSARTCIKSVTMQTPKLVQIRSTKIYSNRACSVDRPLTGQIRTSVPNLDLHTNKWNEINISEAKHLAFAKRSNSGLERHRTYATMDPEHKRLQWTTGKAPH